MTPDEILALLRIIARQQLAIAQLEAANEALQAQLGAAQSTVTEPPKTDA